MKKQEYQKPTLLVVHLQHHHQLLAGSGLRSTMTNLGEEDDLDIDDTPRTTTWGR